MILQDRFKDPVPSQVHGKSIRLSVAIEAGVPGPGFRFCLLVIVKTTLNTTLVTSVRMHYLLQANDTTTNEFADE